MLNTPNRSSEGSDGPKQEVLIHQSTASQDVHGSPENFNGLRLSPRQMRLLEPRTTKRPTVSLVGGCGIDGILFALSAAFFGIGLLVYHFDGMRTARHPTTVPYLLEALRYAPTIFPILFATVVGRATKAFLSWRLERGEKLGFLDLLANCTSVVNSVLAQCTLQSFSIAGFAIAILWAFSPVASQASLRVMSLGSANVTHFAPVTYMSANSSYEFWEADVSKARAVASAIFSASMLAPMSVKRAPVDTWGNVKIPMVERLPDAPVSVTDTRWRDVPTGNTSYAALVGLPMTLPSGDQSAFTIETAYWYLDCASLEKSGLGATILPSRSWQGFAATGTELVSNTSHELVSNTSHVRLSQSWKDDWGCSRRPNQKDVAPRLLVYTAASLAGWTQATCYIGTTEIEAEVTCTDKSCAVSRIRRAQRPHTSSGWTFLDASGCKVWTFFAQNFVQLLTGLASSESHPVPSSGLPSISQGYLLNPSAPATTEETLAHAMWKLDTTVFAERFGQLMNTGWLAQIGFSAMTDVQGEISGWVDPGNRTIRHSVTTAHIKKSVEVVRCHEGWLVVLLLGSGLLMVVSLVPVAVRLFAQGPKFELIVSTLVRDNPYVAAPPGGSALDSARRARLLKDLRVKLGDVMPRREIGHLAVASLDRRVAVEDVWRGRMYD
ncbi:uncharacterized protein LTR77_001506 [Saxophila tyrrhenica]|uniref:Uncharacterized protein n=1 Tax=Saxophila tyrrhenica TaxID=1690608 RepID=A0AAV9PNG2_9PEZI|nr:hypothetical protein LTR77_001506 [Saxophila tyrrhenica]